MPGKAQPPPGINPLLCVLFHRPQTDFPHRVIFFFGNGPDHPGKFHLIA
ncbi:hypothetical protein, partial [Escherichia coli]